MTAREPLFCPTCGRTFNVKLCPRHHVNSRSAQVCAECGSRDLSEPAPRASWSLRLALVAVRVLPVVLVVVVPAVVVLAIVNVVLRDARLQGQVVVIGLFAWIAWWAWHQLPNVVRSGARKGARWVGKQMTNKRQH